MNEFWQWIETKGYGKAETSVTVNSLDVCGY